MRSYPSMFLIMHVLLAVLGNKRYGCFDLFVVAGGAGPSAAYNETITYV